MLSRVRGVVLGFSKAWRDGKYSKFRKILLGFPDEEDVPKLWCTVWGKENWGYRVEDNRPVEIVVKLGMIIEATGHLEMRGTDRSFSIKSDGSMRGGFSALGEYRRFAIVKVMPDEWEIAEDGRLDFEVDKSVVVYRGVVARPLPATEQLGFRTDLVREASFVVEGSPILVDMNPHVWSFDRGSGLTVIHAQVER